MTDTFVILGAGGDLTGRYLLPTLARLAALDQLSGSLQLLAVDRDEETDESFRARALERHERHLPELDAAHAQAVLERLSNRRTDVTSAEQLRTALPGLRLTAAAIDLALLNAVFGPALQALSQLQLPPETRLVVEKPFGTDQADARRLNQAIGQCFTEDELDLGHSRNSRTVGRG